MNTQDEFRDMPSALADFLPGCRFVHKPNKKHQYQTYRYSPSKTTGEYSLEILLHPPSFGEPAKFSTSVTNHGRSSHQEISDICARIHDISPRDLMDTVALLRQRRIINPTAPDSQPPVVDLDLY